MSSRNLCIPPGEYVRIDADTHRIIRVFLPKLLEDGNIIDIESDAEFDRLFYFI